MSVLAYWGLGPGQGWMFALGVGGPVVLAVVVGLGGLWAERQGAGVDWEVYQGLVVVMFFVMFVFGVVTVVTEMRREKGAAIRADLRHDPNVKHLLYVGAKSEYVEFRNPAGVVCSSDLKEVAGHWYLDTKSVACYRRALITNPKVKK